MLSLPRNQCTGCAACVDACTRGAISLVEDENGYLYPKVEESFKLLRKAGYIVEKLEK